MIPERWRKAGGTAFILVAGAAALVALAATDDDEPVAAPDTEDVRATVTELQRTAKDGWCYGWSLREAAVSTPLSLGSNVGEGHSVGSDPTRCKRWIEVRATVDYTSEMDEAEDSARVELAADAETSGRVSMDSLERLGLDESAFINDPETSVLQAAMALPMLASAAGVVDPIPPPPVTAAGTDSAPEAGSDFWRSRWLSVSVIGGLLALAVGGLVLGWRSRRDEIAFLTAKPRGPRGRRPRRSRAGKGRST